MPVLVFMVWSQCIIFSLAGHIRHAERLRGAHGRWAEWCKNQPDHQLPAPEHESGGASESLQQHRRGGVGQTHKRQDGRCVSTQWARVFLFGVCDTRRERLLVLITSCLRFQYELLRHIFFWEMHLFFSILKYRFFFLSKFLLYFDQFIEAWVRFVAAFHCPLLYVLCSNKHYAHTFSFGLLFFPLFEKV